LPGLGRAFEIPSRDREQFGERVYPIALADDDIGVCHLGGMNCKTQPSASAARVIWAGT
jgi:hypothetical protein